MAVAIVPHAGGNPYFGNFGQATPAAKAAITSGTRFELASAGKMMTAIAVLKLWEGGKLGIEDDVRKHLPESLAPPAGKPVVRVADLLRHTSGLPDSAAAP